MVYFAYMRMLTSFHISWDYELNEFSCCVLFTHFFRYMTALSKAMPPFHGLQCLIFIVPPKYIQK